MKRLKSLATLAFVICVMSTVGLAGHAAPSLALPDVYVDNHRFEATMSRIHGELYVDVAALCRALHLDCATQGATAMVGRRPLATARTVDGVTLAALKEIVRLAGVRMQVNADVGIIDILTYDPRATAREIEARDQAARAASNSPASTPAPPAPAGTAQSPPEAARIVTKEEMNGLWDQATDLLASDLNITFDHPVTTHFCSLADLKKTSGSDYVQGLTMCRGLGNDYTLDLYVPYGLSLERTMHVLIHERTHCWQRFVDADMGTPRLCEGFADWTASYILKMLHYGHEIAAMRANMAEDYSEGFQFFERMCARQGPMLTVDYYRNLSWRK